MRAIRGLFIIFLLAIGYVLLDFSVDLRPPNVYDSYRFNIGDLSEDQPIWLKQDNLTILVIRRSQKTLNALALTDGLQDPESRQSHQPGFATNVLRARDKHYFVSYGLGTDLGCPLKVVNANQLGEICGPARYDYSGRAIIGKNQFQNLSIPDYNFSHDFKTLTIRP